jgi:hypothetical protein
MGEEKVFAGFEAESRYPLGYFCLFFSTVKIYSIRYHIPLILVDFGHTQK